VIVSYQVGGVDSMAHALAFGGPSFRGATLLLAGNDPQEQLAYKLPVARVSLWLLGGIMQYSRSLLLQLLKRKSSGSSSSSNMAVVLQPPIRWHTASVSGKGVFAAALKTSTPIVPALVLANGEIVLGNQISAGAEAIATPTGDQVRLLSTQVAVELQNLYQRTTGSPLIITNN
jgi:hypothetical protein